MGGDNTTEQNWLTTASLVALAAVAVGVALIYAQAVLIPFVLALFIGIVIGPILDLQVTKLRIPKFIAAVVTLCVGLAILFVLFLFVRNAVQSVVTVVGKSGTEQGDVFSSSAEPDTDQTVADANEPMEGQYSRSFNEFLEKAVGRLGKWGVNVDVSSVTSALQDNVPNLIKDTFGKVFNFITSAFLVVIFVIFLVIGRDPTSKKPEVYEVIESEVRRYLVIKTIISVATGFMVWFILTLFNLRLAGVFGMLAFLLNFIPSIGSIIATFLPLPVAVAQYDNPWMIVLVIVLPGAVQMSVGNIIEPKLMGKRMHLHPITVLLALSFWGLLWGGVGMILAVPITAVVRIILIQFETLKPIGMLLSGELPDVGRAQT